MGYYIDLKTLSFDHFKKWLEQIEYFIPSRKMLAEDINKRFDLLQSHGVNSLFELNEKLKTKKKLAEFVKISKLPEDYLTHLGREIKSFHPPARKIKDFQYLDEKIIQALQEKGIVNTLKLYNKVVTKKERAELKKELKLSDAEALLLAKLADLSRLRYVSPLFATLLVNSSGDTVEKVQKADPKKLYQELIDLNADNKFYKGNIGAKDMEFLVRVSAFVPLEVEY